MKLLKIDGQPHAVISTEADLQHWQHQIPIWIERGYDIKIVNLIPCPCNCIHTQYDSRGWVEEKTEEVRDAGGYWLRDESVSKSDLHNKIREVEK